MRVLLIASLVACLTLAACGGSSETTSTPKIPVSFPPAKVTGGTAYAPAKSQNYAATLCFWALTKWPKAYARFDTVTFQVPGPGRNYVCKRTS